MGATATTDQWNISFESENTKQTVARVTIFRNEQENESTPSPASPDENEYVLYFAYHSLLSFVISVFLANSLFQSSCKTSTKLTY